jgi:hypothetical protein
MRISERDRFEIWGDTSILVLNDPAAVFCNAVEDEYAELETSNGS